jgi:hypothetical protein
MSLTFVAGLTTCGPLREESCSWRKSVRLQAVMLRLEFEEWRRNTMNSLYAFRIAVH